jgi:DNA-binding MarR family transcriptional regulator
MDRLTLALLRIGQATRSVGLEEAREVGLTPVQAHTLLFARHTKSFATTVGNLAASLGSSHASAIGVVDGLVAKGLMRRERGHADRRVTLLRLTPEGEQAAQRLVRWGHVLEESLVGLSPDERKALERGLGAIVWSLRAAGHLWVAEPCRGCVFFHPGAAPGSPEPHRCKLIEQFLSEDEAGRDCPEHTPPGFPAPRPLRGRDDL